MSNYLYDLGDKGVIRCDLCVPGIDEILHDDRQYSIELDIHFIGTRQRRQDVLDSGNIECWFIWYGFVWRKYPEERKGCRQCRSLAGGGFFR